MKTVTLSRLRFVVVTAAGSAMLLAPTVGWAQQKFKCTFKDPGGLINYTQRHVVDVGVRTRSPDSRGVVTDEVHR